MDSYALKGESMMSNISDKCSLEQGIYMFLLQGRKH